jgi:hypothetical protein
MRTKGRGFTPSSLPVKAAATLIFVKRRWRGAAKAAMHDSVAAGRRTSDAAAREVGRAWIEEAFRRSALSALCRKGGVCATTD